MSKPKKNSFLAIFPYVIVVVVFVVIEICLRAWAPSLETPIVKEVTYDNIEWYQINRRYLEKYFSSGTPLVPEFKESLFRKEKKENTFRVFCLGESSMFGVPYQMTANIPGILRKQLRHAYPEKEIEVVNWGASAINSNAILDLSKALVQFKPDLICVYMGHNEFYGPEGIGANFLERFIPSLIALKYSIRELRLVKVMVNLLSGAKNETSANENLMRQVSQGSKVPLNSADAKWVFENYERNLKKLIKLWQANSVPIIVSDVSSNMMFPPFMYDDIPPQFEHAVQDGFQAGRYEQVLRLLQERSGKEPVNAFVEYWLGKTKLAVQRWGEARVHFAIARDNDLLKFRAPLKIDLIIRDVCKQTGASFISSDSLLVSLSPNDITGDQLFWEHLHPKVTGYYAIARLFTQEIARRHFVPGVDYSHATAVLPFDLGALSICWLDEAYGDLSIQNLTRHWPFTNYQWQPAVWDSADAVLKAIALGVYQRRTIWDQACYQTAEHFWKSGKVNEARVTYEALIEEYPYNYYAHYVLGSLLSKSGDPQEALRHFDMSVKANSDYPNARVDAGLLLINQGEFDAAIKILRGALHLTEGKERTLLRANVLYGLAAANANKENYDEALQKLDEALTLSPTYADALKLKAGILRHLGRQG